VKSLSEANINKEMAFEQNGWAPAYVLTQLATGFIVEDLDGNATPVFTQVTVR
jgi:hypothetical protein